ncbi:type II toxin-antitoxin system VapC family toxin [Geomonas sp.]|uniref:type II toxin-antitoxin system VapC family toxin n=1 Tax=Geomonas sp. TaxID=2651584 RepID=UPI002B47392E|nr:type II toxin-antitoxin system VapC family toxin [Geomonas sp.]HJV33654.1 type II toxin-antitoxin system VapC family toxin [Geomonas sp.]
MLLVDSDVLIWYMRGNERAYDFIEGLAGFSISVITYMELVQGMRNKRELYKLRQSLHRWNARIVYLTEEISAKAMFFVEQRYLSHSVEIADALIGASAVACGFPLLTGNDKHYKAMSGVEIKKFSP